MKILITGGNGYIAQSLEKGLSLFPYDITCVTREDFDLTDKEATDKWFTDKYFDVVIHTAIKGGSRLKPDTGEVFYQNLQMFYNLYYNKFHFSKLIQFGSGAELGQPTTPYGLSKKIIKDICNIEDNFYNIRIFAVFDENELDTRFIKSNIKRYLKGEDLYVFAEKKMDFFYMKDLIKLVNFYIKNDNPPKIIDCTYNKSPFLTQIASLINDQGGLRRRIRQEWIGDFPSYSGTFTNLGIDYIGLEQGIKEVYSKLK